MNISAVLLACIISTILVTGLISHAFAVQLTAFLSPKANSAQPDLTAVRFLTLNYDPGSALAQQFNGKAEHVRFTLNGTAGGMSQLISTYNQAIATERQSPVRFNNATLQYEGDLIGEPNQLLISYKVDLKPSMSNYVLQANGTQGSIIDLDWRSVSVNQPLIVDTPKYGKVNVNYPIGLFQVTHPQLAQQLLNSPAAAIMQDPLFNFQAIGQSMDSWHFLFDPTGSIAGSAGLFNAPAGSRAVSVYALGESSLREGTFTETVKDASATIGGQSVGVHASTPPPSAQIQIPGFSRTEKTSTGEVALVTTQAPQGTVTATGGFPLQVLLVFGGMMGAVAVFVLFKSRPSKKQEEDSFGGGGAPSSSSPF